MKTFETFFYSGLKSLYFGKQLLRYLMVFLSAFFRSRPSLGCELVALRSQLTFYRESIRPKKQLRPRFTLAFRLLWVWLSTVWSGWKPVANLMKPRTVLKWQQDGFRQWWRWQSRRKGGRPAISQEMRTLIRRLSRENVLWSAETIHGQVSSRSQRGGRRIKVRAERHHQDVRLERPSSKGCARPAGG